MTKRKTRIDHYESPYRLVRELLAVFSGCACEESAKALKATQSLDMAISRDKRKIRALKIELNKKR